MKKTIATLAAAASVGLFAGALALITPPPANAAEYERCGRIAGYTVCAIDREFIDSLTIRWTDGDYTHIGVRCGTGDWRLKGYNIGRSDTNAIVRSWCRY